MCMNCEYCKVSDKNAYLYCVHPDIVKRNGAPLYCIKDGSIVVSFKCPFDGSVVRTYKQTLLITH